MHENQQTITMTQVAADQVGYIYTREEQGSRHGGRHVGWVNYRTIEGWLYENQQASIDGSDHLHFWSNSLEDIDNDKAEALVEAEDGFDEEAAEKASDAESEAEEDVINILVDYAATSGIKYVKVVYSSGDDCFEYRDTATNTAIPNFEEVASGTELVTA